MNMVATISGTLVFIGYVIIKVKITPFIKQYGTIITVCN